MLAVALESAALLSGVSDLPELLLARLASEALCSESVDVGRLLATTCHWKQRSETNRPLTWRRRSTMCNERRNKMVIAHSKCRAA